MTDSLFGRLFHYARSTGSEQLENFTTEALAAAIRERPGPFLATLAEHGVLEAIPSTGTDVLVSTQEAVAGVGIVDLVVRLLDGARLIREVWVEVKVWALESGDQLARYQAHLLSRADGDRCTLVTLGPRPLDGVLPWVPWQAVRDMVTRIDESGPLWLELARFLEETNVADVSTEPITAREASSLLDAHSLFKKATRVLAAISEQGSEHHPAWGWGSKDQVGQLVLGRFQRNGQYTLATGARPVYLIVGYSDLRATGEAHLSLFVETDPKKPDVRRSVLSMAEAGGLDPVWLRRLDSWQALARTQRAATIEGLAANIAWFTEGLAELEAAGVRPLSPTP